jgi:hypothetical protein
MAADESSPSDDYGSHGAHWIIKQLLSQSLHVRTRRYR